MKTQFLGEGAPLSQRIETHVSGWNFASGCSSWSSGFNCSLCVFGCWFWLIAEEILDAFFESNSM